MGWAAMMMPKIRWARVGKQIAERVLLDWFCFYLCVPDREEMKRDRASQQRRRSGSAVSRQSTGPPHTTSPASYLYTGTYTNTHRQNALSVNCKCLQHYVCSAFTWYYDSTTATFVISINVCVNVLFKWRKKNVILAYLKKIDCNLHEIVRLTKSCMPSQAK